MLPPLVVYKAKNLYTSWKERGLEGTKYSVSMNGWFDTFNFGKFFFEIALPYLNRKEGKKLIIDDNLSSHISAEVIQSCRENNNEFKYLPPNSTDKLQPLDVGVFGPVKKTWRKILTEYKATNPTKLGLDKSEFPHLLAKLWTDTKPGQYLPAAFDCCGLYPVNIQRAVERIPQRAMETDSQTIREILNSTLGEKLDKLRGTDQSSKPKPRGKKIKVPAGKSYTSVKEEVSEEEKEDDSMEGTSSGRRAAKKPPVF